jgi:hypothetical protein
MRSAYEHDGYVIVQGLFTPDECATYKAETQRLVAELGEHGGVLVGLAANSEVFREAARHPKLLDALESVIGPDIEFLSDKVVYKSKGKEFGSPWHQDWMYWRGAHKISAWIALDPATVENGCLHLVPGSHREVAVHDGTPKEGEGFGHQLRNEAIDETRVISAPCEVGDAVLFHDLTLHASHPNLTGADRYSLISTYRSAVEPDLTYDWAVAAEVVRRSPRSG